MGEIRVRTNVAGYRREVSPPRHPVPPLACDCHMHAVGPFARYPQREFGSLEPPESPIEAYTRTAAILGLGRTVVVQPSFYAKDNACTLDAVDHLGPGARAVVVVEPDVAEAELARMHARGARGIRLHTIARGGVSLDHLEAMAARAAPLGWHLQLWLDARDLPDLASRIRRLPVDVVFDHMAHVDPASGLDEPGFGVLLRLLETGRCWVKLSNGRFAPDEARARRLVAVNPERALWGSDWPHVSYEGGAPDDGVLLDRLADWTPDEATRRRILADNPAALYFGDG